MRNRAKAVPRVFLRRIYRGAWTFYTSGDSEGPLFSTRCFGFSRAIGCWVRGRKAENPFGDWGLGQLPSPGPLPSLLFSYPSDIERRWGLFPPFLFCFFARCSPPSFILFEFPCRDCARDSQSGLGCLEVVFSFLCRVKVPGPRLRFYVSCPTQQATCAF